MKMINRMEESVYIEDSANLYIFRRKRKAADMAKKWRECIVRTLELADEIIEEQ